MEKIVYIHCHLPSLGDFLFFYSFYPPIQTTTSPSSSPTTPPLTSTATTSSRGRSKKKKEEKDPAGQIEEDDVKIDTDEICFIMVLAFFGA